MDGELEAADVNVRPDIDPISIPDQDIAPSVSDRIARIEDVLHIN